MKRSTLFALGLLTILVGPLWAVDLAKIDRTIAKEPAYKSKSVKYCLLVFGPEAKTRVWLVLDGDTLYVDHNGNGDLTEEGERVAAKADRFRDERKLTFHVGDLRDGKLLHKNLTVHAGLWSDLSAVTDQTDQEVLRLVASDPQAQLLMIGIDLEMPPWQGTGPGKCVTWSMTGFDHRGVLKLGSKPQEAPIVHFGGPWQVVLREKHELVIQRDGWLVAHVGTPGLGAGTMAYFAYDGVVPEGLHPTAEVTYPPLQAGQPPVLRRLELKQRCCTFNLYAAVRVPENVGEGAATAVVEFAAWKAGGVAPSRQEIKIKSPQPRGIKLETVSARLKKRFPHPNAGSTLQGLQYSPDGKRIIACDGPGGVVQVWDAETGQWLTRIQTIETGAAASPGSGSFCVSSDWKTVYALMSLCERRSVQRIEKGGKPFDRWIFRGEVRAWNLETGEERARFKHTPEREISVLRLSPDGSAFITNEQLPGEFEPGKWEYGSTIWDARTGRSRPLPDGLEFNPLFAPDGRSFAAIALDGEGRSKSIKIFELATVKPRVTIPIAQEQVNAYLYAFAPDGRVLIGCLQSLSPAKDFRMTLMFWDAVTGRQLASFAAEDKNIFFNSAAAFSPDGRNVAIAYAYGPRNSFVKEPKVYVFEAATGKLARSISLGPKQFLGKLVYSPDGRWLAVMATPKLEGFEPGATTAQDWPQHRIHLIDASTGQIRETLISPQAFSFWSLCFSPDGKTLASGGYGEVLLWDLSQPPGSAAPAKSP